MRLERETKEFFEKYRQRYLDNQQRFSDGLNKTLAEKKDWIAHISYQPYKWLFVLPLLIATTLICGVLAIVTALLFSPRTGGIFGMIWARINSFCTPMTVHVVGADNIEPGTSYVITSNHQSMYDIYVLYGWLGIDFKWVMKKELKKVPVLGLACKIIGHIYIDRSDSKSAVDTIKAARAKIVGGTSVLFFPEGTRSVDGKMKQFKKGAFKMAIDLGIPILPVTINGTRNILPKGSLDLTPGGATMIIHKPIPVTDYHDGNLPELMEHTRRRMNAFLD
ncbi:MAG TPA: lysophospholipid acyltransferase family protein [Smithella sp.]|jgi:1-acyl-sn-glycerol-3-phosphate acyltransferase|nr:lysophospholipid acyltransferase family protein [Smithella sp.]